MYLWVDDELIEDARKVHGGEVTNVLPFALHERIVASVLHAVEDEDLQLPGNSPAQLLTQRRYPSEDDIARAHTRDKRLR